MSRTELLPSSLRRVLRRACLALTTSLALASMAPGAGQAGDLTAASPVPFKAFVDGVGAASAAAFVGRPGYQVTDPAAFEEMRSHLLRLYAGIDVHQSFTRGSATFDCIRYDQQPAVRFQGLKTIASPPPISPSVALHGAPSKLDGHDATPAAESCGAGTFPVRRLTLERLAHFPSLEAFFSKGPADAGHAHDPRSIAPNTNGHAYAYAYQYVPNFGGTSVEGLFSPYVNTSQSEVFSLEQQWYIGGSGATTQTAEVGWQNYPSKYGTESSVLFAYYTADNYVHTGCYNYECGAFVQSSSSPVHLDTTFTSYSTPGGAQYTITLGYYLYAGNWWLAYGNTWVGYYPATLYGYGQMRYNSTLMEFGTESVGSYIWPGEGSGYWAGYGYPYSSYQRTILYRDSGNGGHYPSLTTSQPSPSCYSATNQTWGGSTWQYYFYLGGPGGYGC